MLFYINDGAKKVAVFGPKIVDFLLAGLRPAPRWGSRPRPQLGLPPQTPFTSGELNWRRAETARFRFPIQVMYLTLEPLSVFFTPHNVVCFQFRIFIFKVVLFVCDFASTLECAL
jgi:hypothetical protein